jgi:hypothetical protein
VTLFVCNRCTTKYAQGLPYCPNCTSTSYREDGDVATITKANGATYTDREVEDGSSAAPELALSAPGPAQDLSPADEAGQDTAPGPDTDSGYAALTVVELRQLLRDRNTERAEDDQLPLSGSKAELVERLQDDDEATAGADNPADDG